MKRNWNAANGKTLFVVWRAFSHGNQLLIRRKSSKCSVQLVPSSPPKMVSIDQCGKPCKLISCYSKVTKNISAPKFDLQSIVHQLLEKRLASGLTERLGVFSFWTISNHSLSEKSEETDSSSTPINSISVIWFSFDIQYRSRQIMHCDRFPSFSSESPNHCLIPILPTISCILLQLLYLIPLIFHIFLFLS